LISQYREGLHARQQPLTKLDGEISKLEWEQAKRERRGWSRDAELDQRLIALKPQRESLRAEVDSWIALHPDAQVRHESVRTSMGVSATFHGVWERESWNARDRYNGIRKAAQARNLAESPMVRGWIQMGERFLKVLNYRTGRGSEAFAGHVASARAGRIKDWSWAEKDVVRAPTSTKEAVRFTLKVADNFRRVGGRAIETESSEALKTAFALNEVEYGLWVAGDLGSAKFHTEGCAGALADLADLLGVENPSVSLGGKLSFGFGSRGQGSVGFRTEAPAAMYIPRYRIVNITKMSRGGTLGHEWFHAFDNLLPELMTGAPSGEPDHMTERPDLLPPGPVRDAVQLLVTAMMEGPHRKNVYLDYTGSDLILARRNVGRTGLGLTIETAGSAEKAVAAVYDYFSKYRDKSGELTRRRSRTRSPGRRLRPLTTAGTRMAARWL
jgi:hypothetical protein